MQPFLDEAKFSLCEDGSFENEKAKISVKYVDEKQVYTLSVALRDVDGTFGDLKEIDSWLFDDTQNEKDTVAVGIDFVNCLRKVLGMKQSVSGNHSVDLPTASKSDSMDINGFAKKMLDVFPSLKDKYKEFVSEYGNFLYINFFGEYLVPQIKTLFTSGTKKQIKKFYDVLEDAYLKGDRDTVNIVVAVLAAASYNDEAVNNSIKEMLADNSHFTAAYLNFVPVFKGNKKLVAALIK